MIIIDFWQNLWNNLISTVVEDMVNTFSGRSQAHSFVIHNLFWYGVVVGLIFFILGVHILLQFLVSTVYFFSCRRRIHTWGDIFFYANIYSIGKIILFVLHCFRFLIFSQFWVIILVLLICVSRIFYLYILSV